MDAVRHADLAHQLITACEGVDTIVRERLCRVGSSQLYAYTDPGQRQFMPADVIADLEAWHGEPIYSRALFEARPASAQIVQLLDAACKETHEAARLQELVLEAVRSPGGLSPRTRKRIEAAITRLEDRAREFRASLEAGAS